MNLAGLIEYNARYRGSMDAVVARDSALSYAQLYALARRVAARLRRNGVAVGVVVGVHMRDTPQHLATLVAVMHVGGIILPIDWRAKKGEVDRIVARFLPSVVVIDGKGPRPGGVAVVDLSGIDGEEPDDQPAARFDDQALVYSLTSGTTGEPKGIVLTHAQFFGRTMALVLERVMQPEDRFLAALPLAYSNGRVILLSLLSIGATVAMLPTLFETRELVAFVNEQRVTGLMVSPNIARDLIVASPTSGLLLPALRVFVSGGAKLQPDERAAISARVTANVIDYYGSTGGGPTAIIATPEEGAEGTSMGRPMLTLTVEIVGDDGALLPVGDLGRVRVRGPGVCRSFVGMDAGGDETFRDGWYYPGDVGWIDTGGLLHLHGRASELIKRGGLMVYAQEVEQVLRRHPAVVDAAVVGAPSPELGQEVAAFVATGEAVTGKDLKWHCRRELAPFKVPTRIVIVEALPRNASGKVLKTELLARLLSLPEDDDSGESGSVQSGA